MSTRPIRFARPNICRSPVVACWIFLAALCGLPTAFAQTDTAVRQHDAAIPIVWLAADEPTSDHERLFQDLLTRELVRQALLIAARDELGLITRDETLREPMAEGAASASVIHVSTHGKKEAKLQVSIWRERDDARETLWEKELPVTDNVYEYYFPLIHAVENASRSELVDVLQGAGFEGQSKRDSNDVALRDEIESDLARANFVSQFAAIRETHEQICRDGESPELVAALVRGYAHLGFLTNRHWNAMCKAFHARSLLYAERLATSTPESEYNLRLRAYARAWAGLHAAALADLAKANEMAGDEQRPTWVRLVEAHCKYDFETLRTIAKEDVALAELADMLALMDLARGGGTANVIQAAEATLSGIPECYLIYDRLCEFGGVIHLHTATLRGAQALSKYLPVRLRSIRELPKEIKDKLPASARTGGLFGFFGPGPSDMPIDVPSRAAAELAAADVAASDTGELSWTTLARMIQEESFLQTVARARFLKTSLGVPVDDFIASVSPEFKDHPYAGWLESMAIKSANDPKGFRQALLKVQVGDLRWTVYPFVGDAHAVPLANAETGSEMLRRMYRRFDLVTSDIEVFLYWLRGNTQSATTYAELFRVISPHSPRFIAAMAEHSDDRSRSTALAISCVFQPTADS